MQKFNCYILNREELIDLQSYFREHHPEYSFDEGRNMAIYDSDGKKVAAYSCTGLMHHDCAPEIITEDSRLEEILSQFMDRDSPSQAQSPRPSDSGI